MFSYYFGRLYEGYQYSPVYLHDSWNFVRFPCLWVSSTEQHYGFPCPNDMYDMERGILRVIILNALKSFVFYVWTPSSCFLQSLDVGTESRFFFLWMRKCLYRETQIKKLLMKLSCSLNTSCLSAPSGEEGRSKLYFRAILKWCILMWCILMMEKFAENLSESLQVWRTLSSYLQSERDVPLISRF